MTQTGTLADVVESRRVNAGLSWLLVVFVLGVVVASVANDDLLWAGFAGAVAALSLVPPLSYRNPTAMLPWEVLVLAALPLLGRAFTAPGLTSQVATYLSVAALALIVAVELHVFTTVRMTYWFAVLFVVLGTMATAGVWAVVQWLSDTYLGTTFLTTDYRLMWDLVAATVAGLVAGGVFELYFRRRVSAERHLPEELKEAAR